MANVTRNLSLSKSAYLKKANPNTVYPTSSGTAYLISGDDYSKPNALLLGFGTWPSSLKRNRLIKARLKVRIGTGYEYLDTSLINRDFDASTMTWNKRPSFVDVSLFEIVRGHEYGDPHNWTDMWIETDYYSTGGTSASDDARKLITAGGVYLTGDGYVWEYSQDGNMWYAQTNLGEGGNAYIEVTYSDSVMVTSQVTPTYTPSYPKPQSAMTFKWA